MDGIVNCMPIIIEAKCLKPKEKEFMSNLQTMMTNQLNSMRENDEGVAEGKHFD